MTEVPGTGANVPGLGATTGVPGAGNCTNVPGSNATTNVAVIGAGLIGRAWCTVFARAGFHVTVWDQFPQQTRQALSSSATACPSCAPPTLSPPPTSMR